MMLPISINVSGRPCLIVGGGAVAHRKTESLLQCEADVTLISPELSGSFQPIASRVEWRQREWQEGDCRGYELVFACTDNSRVNTKVLLEAKQFGIWCNVCDDPTQSTFHSAATVRRGDLCIGISTAGGSPALARHVKEEIGEVIGPEYGELIKLMGSRRDDLRCGLQTQEERAHAWRAALKNDDLLCLLRAGKVGDAENLLGELLNSP